MDSLWSIASSGSILSIGSAASAGSVLSARARWSLLSAASRGTVLGEPMTTRQTVVAALVPLVLGAALLARTRRRR